MSLECKLICKKCPDAVVLGAESTLSLEVDGITAAKYVRAGSAGDKGRALQSGDTGSGVTTIQSSPIIFEGA